MGSDYLAFFGAFLAFALPPLAAIADRSALVSFLARAGPPLTPPKCPSFAASIDLPVDFFGAFIVSSHRLRSERSHYITKDATMTKEVVIKNRSDMNRWCRQALHDALTVYGMTPREWARVQGVSEGVIGDWMNGHKELTIDYLIALIGRTGAKLRMTPPEKPTRPKEKRMTRRQRLIGY